MGYFLICILIFIVTLKYGYCMYEFLKGFLSHHTK